MARWLVIIALITMYLVIIWYFIRGIGGKCITDIAIECSWELRSLVIIVNELQ